MNIKNVTIANIGAIAPLIAKFRVELLGLKSVQSSEDVESAKEEFESYIKSQYPIYVYQENGEFLGYLVCRVDGDVVWVESLFVLKEHRRRGIAAALFAVAEELAKSHGNDTLYNYVHPNNDGMISFLSNRGYNVLNLIEVRKKYEDEKTTEKIQVRNNFFDY